MIVLHEKPRSRARRGERLLRASNGRPTGTPSFPPASSGRTDCAVILTSRVYHIVVDVDITTPPRFVASDM